MKCKDVYRHICERLDQGLDSPECREIRKHLDSCTDCQAYLDSLKKTVALYRSVQPPPISPGTHRQLLKTISILTARRPRKGDAGTPKRVSR